MKTRSLRKYFSLLVIFGVIALVLIFILPMLGSSRFITQTTLDSFVTKINSELDKTLFPAVYVGEALKYNAIDRVIGSLEQIADNYPFIEELTVVRNGELIKTVKHKNVELTGYQIINKRSESNDSLNMTVHPFLLDAQGGIYIPAMISYFSGNDRYQINFLIHSFYLEEMLHTNPIADGYLLMDFTGGREAPLILPLFGNVDGAEALTVLERAWRRYHNEGRTFFSFTAFNKRYITWLTPVAIGIESGMVGFIVPQEMVLAPFNRIITPIIILIIIFLVGYTLFITGIIMRIRQRQNLDINTLLKQGESETLEYKASMRWDYTENRANPKLLEAVIVKSVAAFSNSQGGILLIGISDKGTVIGIENDYATLKKPGTDFYELHLRTLIINNYGESFGTHCIEIEFTEAEGKTLCLVHIKKSDTPLYTVTNGREYFYVRCGNSSRTIEKPSEIEKYINERFRKLRL
jgi:hypothetical protein